MLLFTPCFDLSLYPHLDTDIMLTYQIDLDISDTPPQVDNMLLLWQDLGVGGAAIGAAAPQIARAIVRKRNEDDQDMVSLCRPLDVTYTLISQTVGCMGCV